MTPLDTKLTALHASHAPLRMRALPLWALLFALPWLMPEAALAQVSRCVDRSGNTVFTDRPCEAVDSASRVPRVGATHRGDSAYRGACARSLPALIRDLSAAIDSRDVNRLGMLYLWAGVSDERAVRTFNRLQSIVERPLIDIVPLRRELSVAAAPASDAPAADVAPAADAPPSAPKAPRGTLAWGATAAESGTSPSQPAAGDETAVPAATRTRSVVTGLRLEQTVGRRATPSQTTLGLRRAYDCWWINLPGD